MVTLCSVSQNYPLTSEALYKDCDFSHLCEQALCFVCVCLWGVEVLIWVSGLVLSFQTKSHFMQVSFELTLGVGFSCLYLRIPGLGHQPRLPTLAGLFFLPRLEPAEQCQAEVLNLDVFVHLSLLAKMYVWSVW